MQINRKSLLPHIFVFISILIFTFTLRSPFFFQDVIDWDESTFILMGQSILDGHLPYTEVWDNKPPLLFAVFAVFIKIFGQNIVGIRVAGAICVSISAFFLYLTLEKGWGKRISILLILMPIYTMTILTSGQAVMSEHIALVPIMIAFYVLANKDNRRTINCFMLGALLACATLIRLNLIYLNLIVGFWLLFVFLRQKESLFLIFKQGLAYGVGNILVVFATFFPYFYARESYTWWQSVILAPLNYSSSQGSIPNSVLYFIAGDEISSIGFLLTTITGWLVWQNWQTFSLMQQKIWQASFIFYGAIALSIIKSGETFEHYFIQVAPFWGIMLINAFQLPQKTTRTPKIFVTLLIGILLFSSIKPEFPVRGYLNLSNQLIRYQSPWMGTSYPMANYINQHNSGEASIYILGPHFVHWLTETMPLSRCSTHPSNTFRKSLLPYCGVEGSNSSPTSEIQFILNKKPQYILLRDSLIPRFLNRETDLKKLFQENLDSNYELVFTIGQDKLYSRVK